MIFGIILLCFNLVIPLLMLLIGRVFIKNPPKSVNWVYGYRTTRSMQNQETWDFAHQECGKVWTRIGLISLPISVAASLPLLWMQGENAQGILSCVIEGLQIIILLASIVPVEQALKKRFDTSGNDVNDN